MQKKQQLTIESFDKQRQELFQKRDEMRYPGMKFTETELQANELFIVKRDNCLKKEIPKDFFTNCVKYFQEFKKYSLYSLIESIPKTSLFHIHSDVCCDQEWFFNTLDKYKENIYMTQGDLWFLYYFKGDPPKDDDKDYKLLDDLRKNTENFDEQLKKKLWLQPEDIELEADPKWTVFIMKLISVFGLLKHKDVYPDYMLNFLNLVAKDGVQHVCLRITPGEVLETTEPERIQMIENCAKQVRETYPYFTYTLIYQGIKSFPAETWTQNMEKAFEMAKAHPHLEFGFDLVDSEDRYPGQNDMKEMLINKYQEFQKKYQSNIHYCFHAGETLDKNRSNMTDSIILGTKRLGHAFQLNKQPYLIPEVKKRGIVIEVCALSNHLMGFWDDMRVHPAQMMHESGVQISLSSDDPGVFQLSPTIHDYLAVILAFEFNLKDIKRLQLNGIDGMLLSEELKQKHLQVFQERWDKFISEFLKKEN